MMINKKDKELAGKVFYDIFVTLIIGCMVGMIGYSINNLVSMWGINIISIRLLIKAVLFMFFCVIFGKAIFNDYKVED